MICEKLPETKEEMITQLNKSIGKSATMREIAAFWQGVANFKQMHEQKVSVEYLKRMTPVVVEIAKERK